MRPIDGDALVEHLEKLSEAYNELYNNLEIGNPSKSIMYGKYTTLVETMIDVRHMPTLDYEPVRHGEWDDKIIPFCNVCSVCKVFVDRGCFPTVRHKGCLVPNIGELKYCPNCGAKMDAKEDER